MKKTIFFIVILAVGLSLTHCSEKEMTPPPKREPVPAAKFSLPSLNGKKISLSDYKGRPVIINFWASWCVPCVTEMPLIEKIYSTWKEKGLAVLAINLKEDEDVAKKFMEEKGYSFTTLLDESGETSDKFQVFGLPSTYFIDSDGVIQYSHMGQLTTEIVAMGLESINLTEL